MDKAHSASWVGAFIALLGTLKMSDLLALGGFSLALIGTIATVWHKWQMVKIEREKLEREFPKKSQ